MRGLTRAVDPDPPRRNGRRELVTALVIAWVLVVLRGAVFVVYEQSFFDSDQANFGLMAKHLSEFRSFPLFCYGQAYMLGVDAWLAVPWFWVFGPTVAALHSSLVLTNLVAVTLLVVILHRDCGLRPWLALLASLPFAFTPPLIAASLLEAAGSIGPFVYVPLLWLLRKRALWFGFVLAFGFLHREFTAYVVPVLIVIELWQQTLWRPERIRFWLVAAVVGLGTWQFVEALKPYADMMGPGTRGQLIRGYGGSQVGNLTDRINLTPSEMPSRLVAMVVDHLPRLYGSKAVHESIATQGHDWLFWPLWIGIALALGRAMWILGRQWSRRTVGPPGATHRATGADVVTVVVPPTDVVAPNVETTLPPARPDPSFAFYLTGVGLVAIAAYVATRGADAVVDRYLLLGLYLPVGALALFFLVENVRTLRVAMTALMLVWACGSASDHWRQVVRYRSGSEPNDMRVLADTLVSRGIHVAQAGYWRAYKLTFLAREQVKVASTDYIRIDEYQRLANAEGNNLITIQEEPCAGGDRIGPWYLCR